VKLQKEEEKPAKHVAFRSVFELACYEKVCFHIWKSNRNSSIAKTNESWVILYFPKFALMLLCQGSALSFEHDFQLTTFYRIFPSFWNNTFKLPQKNHFLFVCDYFLLQCYGMGVLSSQCRHNAFNNNLSSVWPTLMKW
jgi:hypothetical protein